MVWNHHLQQVLDIFDIYRTIEKTADKLLARISRKLVFFVPDTSHLKNTSSVKLYI